MRDYSGETLYYFEDTSANMGYNAITSEILADAPNDWIGDKNIHDSSLTLSNFITFCANNGITVTSSGISHYNTNNNQYSFPNGEKNFIFFAAFGTSCYLEFTVPTTGTCELKYGNTLDQTRIYLNDFTDANWIDRIEGDYESKIYTFNVIAGDKIRLVEYGTSVSYFYHIKFMIVL